MPWSPRKAVNTNLKKMSLSQLEKKYVALEEQFRLRKAIASELIERYQLEKNGVRIGDYDMRNRSYVQSIGHNHFWRFDGDEWDKFVETYLIGDDGEIPVMLSRPYIGELTVIELAGLYIKTKNKFYRLLEVLRSRGVNPREIDWQHDPDNIVDYDGRAFLEHHCFLDDIAETILARSDHPQVYRKIFPNSKDFNHFNEVYVEQIAELY